MPISEKDLLVFILDSADRAYRTLVETANEDMVKLDAEFKFTYVGKRLINKTGYSQEELIGRPWLDFVDEESKAYSELRMEKTRQGIDESYELKIIHKDGSPYWAIISAKPLFDENGKFKGALAMLTDITEYKNVEEALRESEEKYRNIVETTNEGIWTLDTEARIIYVNEKMAGMLGYSREELSGRLVFDFFDEKYRAIFKLNMEKRKQGIDHTLEIKLKPKDGSFFWVLVSSKSFFDTDGKFAGVLAMLTDITERKQAEEALKKAHDDLEETVKERTAELVEANKLSLENERRFTEAQKVAHIGSWDKDIVTGKLYWSDETYRIYGRSPQEFGATYDAFLSYVHPDDRDYVDNAVKEAVNGKPYNLDYRIILANGEERIIHAQGGTIFNCENIPVRLRGIVQDVTERKKAEEALANFEIARKKEIHHRIKNNLQVISSLLDLQAEKFSNRECIRYSEIQEAFRESQDRVLSMALIHEELYKGKGFEGEGFEGEGLETLNFSPYIEELAENLFLTYRLGNNDISLNTDLEKNLFFDMDTAVPLGIIVNELISNSLKHAFAGRDKGEIRIKLHRVNVEYKSKDCRSTNFILSVSDNGVGIPENLEIEDLESLGLQLVTTLVDQLDGELELKRNNGTEFTMKFTVTGK